MGTLLAVSGNPARRRKTSRRRSPVRSRARRRARRNPLLKNDIMSTVKDGAIGAGGALGVKWVMNKLPVDEKYKSGWMGAATTGLVGVGIGYLLTKFGRSRELGKKIAGGALTVALYGVGRDQFGAQLGVPSDTAVNGLFMDGLGYQDWPPQMDSLPPVDNSMGYYNTTPLGAYDEF